MDDLNDLKYILQVESKYLIVNYPDPLYLINHENILAVYEDDEYVVIKLPYNSLIFKPEETIPFEDSPMDGVKMLTRNQFLKLFPTINDGSQLSSVYDLNSTKYYELAQNISTLISHSLLNFAEKNALFKIKVIHINYTVANKSFPYLIMVPKDLNFSISKLTTCLTPFNLASISWCYQMQNKSQTIILLIYMPNSYPDSYQNFAVERIEQWKLIISILRKYIPRIEPRPKNILCSSQSSPVKNDVNISLLKIEPNTFSDIQTSFNSPLVLNKSYLTDEQFSKIRKWIILAFQCCIELSKGNNVIIEDIEQMPSSIIIGSLSKIMIDQNYCTFDGFLNLIREDWINRAYFYNVDEISLKNRLHIFYSWLICVQFLVFKYPFNFEFTFWLIHYITNNLWTNRFFPFSYKCFNGDIFEMLVKYKSKFINIGYYSKKSRQVYYSIVKEINPKKSNNVDQVGKFDSKCLAHSAQFYDLFVIDLDTLKNLNSDIQTLVLLREGRIPEFISKSFFDPDALDYKQQIDSATKPKKNLPSSSTNSDTVLNLDAQPHMSNPESQNSSQPISESTKNTTPLLNSDKKDHIPNKDTNDQNKN